MAMADGKMSAGEKAQLTNDLYAVMNSANVPPEEVSKAIADAQEKAAGLRGRFKR